MDPIWKSDMRLTLSFHFFFASSQMSNVTPEYCLDIINKFEVSEENKQNGVLGIEGEDFVWTHSAFLSLPIFLYLLKKTWQNGWILFLSTIVERNVYRFGMSWGWVNDDNIFIFLLTIPLRSKLISEQNKLNINKGYWMHCYLLFGFCVSIKCQPTVEYRIHDSIAVAESRDAFTVYILQSVG